MATIISHKSVRQVAKRLVEIPGPIWTPSQFIAGERYVLRQFNYPKDMLQRIDESVPANKKEMDPLVANLKKHNANQKPGQFASAWVGAGTKPKKAGTNNFSQDGIARLIQRDPAGAIGLMRDLALGGRSVD